MSRSKRRKPGGGRGNFNHANRASGGRRAAPDNRTVTKQNELFEKYYNELGVVSEDEREAFWETLRRELPNSFRFTGSKGHALPVQQRLKDYYIPEITSIEYEGKPVNPPTSIPWYPNELAWQMTTPKNVVRRFAPFASFQKFLVSETSVGNISRQEIVSMIPPLLMDLKPGMTVLDLCAAPGSKSAQLIEMIHAGEESTIQAAAKKSRQAVGLENGTGAIDFKGDPAEDVAEEGKEVDILKSDLSDEGRSTGLLVANDVDYKRAHMLIHQMKRLNSPNLIVTNHDATLYPSIRLPPESTADAQAGRGRYLKFDRILADVPCSGDGTPRKNVNVWKNWGPQDALGLHITQVRILVRALQMLKTGGRVVYSTCSMNPVEDEAVVAAAIERCGGMEKVSIVDCSDQLPLLKRSHGLRSWKIMDKQGKMWESWDEVKQHRSEKGADGLGRLAETMFSGNEGSKDYPLERCMRVFAHQQDTGAFFITVLEKRGEIRARPEVKTEVVQPTSAKVSVITAVEAIEAMPTNGTSVLDKIDGLDELAPPHHVHGDEDGVSASARQNQENAPNALTPGQKRDLDEEEESSNAAPSNKKAKFREELDEAAPHGEEDRLVHYPPPPGAELELTAHKSISNEPPKRKGGAQQFEEPFKYLSADHPELDIIYKFYDIHPSFPRDRFMVRNAAGTPAKTIYYTSTLARDILRENEGRGVKFVHCGVKMFVKQDVQREDVCRWRIQTDGLPVMEAWVGDSRVVRLWSKRTLRGLLVDMFPKVTGDGWRSLGEIGERVRDIGMGCCILRVEAREGEDGFSESMVLPLWRSLHSLNLMLPKEDRKAMLLRIYNEDVPLMDSSKDRFKKQAEDADSDGGQDVDMTPGAVTKDEDAMMNEDAGVNEVSEDEDDSGGVSLSNTHSEAVRAAPHTDARGDVLENASVIYPPS